MAIDYWKIRDRPIVFSGNRIQPGISGMEWKKKKRRSSKCGWQFIDWIYLPARSPVNDSKTSFIGSRLLFISLPPPPSSLLSLHPYWLLLYNPLYINRNIRASYIYIKRKWRRWGFFIVGRDSQPPAARRSQNKESLLRIGQFNLAARPRLFSRFHILERKTGKGAIIKLKSTLECFFFTEKLEKIWLNLC